MILDRIVCGNRYNTIRKKLLQESDLSLQKCADICRAAEKKNAAQVKTMNPQENVHAIKKASKPKTIKKPKGRSRKNPLSHLLHKIAYVTTVVNNIPEITVVSSKRQNMLSLWQKKNPLQSRVS